MRPLVSVLVRLVKVSVLVLLGVSVSVLCVVVWVFLILCCVSVVWMCVRIGVIVSTVLLSWRLLVGLSVFMV